MDINASIAREVGVKAEQVAAAAGLLDDDCTVPFIARYRKEKTGGLDDTQLRRIEERLRYRRELEERRRTILEGLRQSGKLTPELERQILEADTKVRLEDLYLPYRPKRKTRGQAAREAGLEPLADLLLGDPGRDPETEAAPFVSAEKGYADATAVLEGARAILAERFAEDAELIGELRETVWKEGRLASRVIEGKEKSGAKFSDYFEFAEPLKKVPSHRALALLRGRKAKVLRLQVSVAGEEESGKGRPLTRCEGRVAARFGLRDEGRPADPWLLDAARAAWRTKLMPHLEAEAMARVRESAEEEAIRVFTGNLRDLLLAAPAGQRSTMGLDPGLRTGVKVAIVDPTGKLVQHGAIFPHAPRNQWDESIEQLAAWAREHSVELVSIGNGTASRETDRLVTELSRRHGDLALRKVVVSESGASVYSASELAAREFPDLDVSFRGAVSIARRLQDPLAELVKIEPRSIGVGQYQHDVHQGKLARSLDAVVEDCVNAVGVDVNTASCPLLKRVSGLDQRLARNIVQHRDEHGAFASRESLLQVPRMGAKRFEQAAGFLRVFGGENPLDASAVHPEAYPVVRRIAERSGEEIASLVGNSGLLKGLDPAQFADETFGVPTVSDILRELEKPGRDPRPEFVTCQFREGVEKPADLELGMVLEGVVSNVTNFGAFVDVGVHQDGLVHISELSDRYVDDPRSVVKAGDIVKVKVLEVDLERQRVGLTCRLDAPTEERDGRLKTMRPPRRRAAGGGGRRAEGGAPPAGSRSGRQRGGEGGRSRGGRDGSRGSGQRREPRRERTDRRESARPERGRPPAGKPTVMSKLLDRALQEAKERERESRGS